MRSMQDRGCICFPVHNTILSLNYLGLAHLETQSLVELSFHLEAHQFTFFSHPFIFISFLLLRKQRQSTSPSGQNLVPNFLIYYSSPSTWLSSGSQSVSITVSPRLYLCHCFVEMFSMCVALRIAWKMIVYVSKFSSVFLLWDILADSSQRVLPLPLSTSMVLLSRVGVLPRFIPTTVWLVSCDCCLKLTMHWVAYNIFLRFQRQQL